MRQCGRHQDGGSVPLGGRTIFPVEFYVRSRVATINYFTVDALRLQSRISHSTVQSPLENASEIKHGFVSRDADAGCRCAGVLPSLEVLIEVFEKVISISGYSDRSARTAPCNKYSHGNERNFREHWSIFLMQRCNIKSFQYVPKDGKLLSTRISRTSVLSDHRNFSWPRRGKI